MLIIGGGTGWIVPHILESGAVEKLQYVEASARMLEMARKNCPVNLLNRVEFIHGDENAIPDIKYDVAITNFFLDCFKEDRLKEVMATLYRHLKPQGHLYFTDFHINQKSLHRIWQRSLTRLMLEFFKRATNLESSQLLDFPSLFDHYDLKVISTRTYYASFIQSMLLQKHD